MPTLEGITGTALATVAAGVAAVYLYSRHRKQSEPDPAKEEVLKQVIFFRHGQGHHNVKDAHGKSALHIFDAHLTAQGEGEARAIGEPGGALASVASVASAAAAPPQVAFISPLWRTMQTADLALAGLKSVPRFALEDAREGNNNCGCNHRHKLGDTHKALGMTHREAFPLVDWSLLESDAGYTPGAEARPVLKDEIAEVRIRASRLLQFLKGRPETNMAVFSHQGLIRNVGAVVMGLDTHHSMSMPATGSAFVIQLVGDPNQPELATHWQIASKVTTEPTKRFAIN